MNTSYVDMYFIHYVKNAKNELTNEVKAWAEKAKAEGKIRFFGYCYTLDIISINKNDKAM